MPSKKKKYNSRFPPARIKKIMQSDEEVGKVAQVVPIIISKALEMFVQSLLRSSSEITRSRNARTLTPNHIKASILSCDEFHFLRDIAQTIPDVNPGADGDDEEGATSGSATPYPHNSTNRSTHPMSASGQAAATVLLALSKIMPAFRSMAMSGGVDITGCAANSVVSVGDDPLGDFDAFMSTATGMLGNKNSDCVEHWDRLWDESCDDICDGCL
ncbi:unnamed protein product [Oppiella nova]|uniref:Dr1-associated corepressor n=1 Tax=Oppiella nova TaxID=334625 RepID=A0A7R9LXD4_9ACAR|nr:unnamed protein product [Oppiella nova]CAG2167585.1 unnamed protein product [Oppiella nova]